MIEAAAVPAEPGDEDALAGRINRSRRRYEMAEAETLARTGLQQFPDSGEILIALGRVLLATHRPAEAADAFTRAEGLLPEDDRPIAWRIAVHSRQRSFAEAIALGTSAVGRFPNSSRVRVALGRVHLDSSDPDEALRDLADATALAPTDVTAACWHAVALTWLYRFADAEAVVQKLLEREPDAAEAHYRLGRVLLGNSHFSRALDCFATALRADPDHTNALIGQINTLRRRYRYDEAETLATTALLRFPSCAQLHVEYALIFSDQGRNDEAAVQIERATAIDPHGSQALCVRVIVLQYAHRFDEAEQAAAEAIDRRPDDPDVHGISAWLLGAHERYDEAATQIERALAIDPRDSSALCDRISYLRWARRFDDAERAGTEALDRRPNDPDVHLTVAALLSTQDRDDEAAARATRALDIDPRDSSALGDRIDYLRWARRFDDAEQAAAEALGRRPDAPGVHLAVAGLLSAQERYDEAVTQVERALAIDPLNATALRDRINYLRWARRFDDTEQAVTQALDRRPNDPAVHLAVAALLSAQDRDDEAAARTSQALAIDPLNATALRDRINYLRWARRFDDAEQAVAQALDRRPNDPAIRLAVAGLLSAQERYDEAVTQVERALAIDPLDATALPDRITYLRGARRFDDAEQAVAQALDRRPNDPAIHCAFAWLLGAQGRADEAAAQAARALEIDPLNSPALQDRIRFLRWAHRFDEAGQAAAEALDRQPDDPAIHLAVVTLLSDQERYDEAVTQVERALAIDPLNARALRDRIYVLVLARRFDDADQAVVDALDHRPDEPDIHLARAALLSAQDRDDEAAAQAARALDIDPLSSMALRVRIDYLRWARRFDEAEQAAAQALDRRPNDPDIHLAVAGLLSDQDRDDEAAAQAARALDIDPLDSGALRDHINYLAWARRFDEAEQAAAQALDRRPNDPDVHSAYAWLLGDQDRNDEAAAHAARALEINPLNTMVLRDRINFLCQAGRLDEAEQVATEALKRRPDNSDVHVAIGWAKNLNYQYEAALSSFQQALTIDPKNFNALRLRTSTLRALRRPDEAARAAADALELRPKSLSVRIEMGRIHDDRLDFDSALTCYEAVLHDGPNNIGAHIARSTTLRALRRYAEADREISRLCNAIPTRRDLKTELAWINHDERRLAAADRIFQDLLSTALNNEERGQAHHGRGWIAFTEGRFTAAEQQFRRAIEEVPADPDYKLGLAWALTRQNNKGCWKEAEEICYQVADIWPEPSTYVCLGVLSFKQSQPSSAEYYLKKALEIDPYEGSYTDLGALYAKMARYDEAEIELRKAIDRDWYHVAAHIELGNLLLKLDVERLPEAEREFRQAIAIDPASGTAMIGLAQALIKAGDEAEAEATLHEALNRQSIEDEWRTHLALARLLVQRGDKQQNLDLYSEAYAQAQKAIGLAPDGEADPHFVAGVAHHRMGSLTADARGRFAYRRRALQHLRQCLQRDPGHVEAGRNLHLLEREMKATAPAVWGGYAIAAISFLLLATMWIMFFLSSKVTITLLSVNTPVLVGLFTVSTLLPALIRLKLPGFEADLQAGNNVISPGPTGEVTFGPGRFTVATGPTGQLPRHG